MRAFRTPRVEVKATGLSCIRVVWDNGRESGCKYIITIYYTRQTREKERTHDSV